MSVIRAEHVEELVKRTDPSPLLVVLEGRARVVSRDQLEEPEHKGALVVADRDEILGGRGAEEVTRADAEALARRLDSAVGELGG
ncbi:hypothetical protein SAMN02745673_01402 [Marinactinospora thermotolerans DSM 45154]|uniref:Uncharacterized protein n=1 Tax=Marinactinospora thermotolerans DSM 45154 TaxID=1122192 RepID=A0A1T4NF33_9ACTN|nr:hypothetical protein [Marinactinospora thermotolerans]SJZ77398.1 hypothetical protein SAMN02745673_01402 [Marinactinospora thermotolerans DSM 45154]